MTQTALKLYEVAKHLNELNKDGKVKGFKGNEERICQNHSDMSRVFLFGFITKKNDDLIIDLLISPSAFDKSQVKCETAVKTFKNHFGFFHRTNNMGTLYRFCK